MAVPPQRPRASEADWLSEARYRAIVEDQPDLVCRFLSDGTLTFANDAYCAFFGLRREDVIGRRYQPIVHPEDLADVQAKVASLSAANPVVYIENRVFRVDGAVRWTEWSNRALLDEHGNIVEFQSAGRDVTDRKRTEADAARLAAIVASADVAIYATTLEGVITSWNRAAERMFGYTAAEAIGQPLSMIIPSGYGDGSDVAARVKRGESVGHIETEKLTKAGERVPVSLAISPITDASGRILGISRIARDISERKRAERELQERESRFRLMADHAPVLIWVADVQNRGIFFNQPWLEFTGRALERQLGDGWLELIHPDDRAAAGAHCQAHFEQRRPFTMEFRLRHASGQHRWVQDSGQPLFLPDGTFNGYIGSCVDIQDRKEAEDRVRRILAGISDAFSAVDREWRFTYVNDYYTRLVGLPREQLLGRVCWEVFPEAQRTTMYDVALRAMREQTPQRIEDFYTPLDLWFEIRLYPTLDGLISFITDISQRKRLEAAREEAVRRETEARTVAEEASRLKDEFLAVVSHELRTPLHAMLGWAQMLRAGNVPADVVAKAVETIERNARLQAQLIDDLLDVSRIVSGNLALRHEPVGLATVVAAAVDAVGLTAAGKQIDLRLDLTDRDARVTGDSQRLQQAVANLLTNAIKFTPPGGRVDVVLGRRDDQAIISVRDTGAGIPPHVLPFIFDRFRQADSRTTRVHGGLGLGLTIVNHVAVAHGGSVRATSAGAGHGATFELILPTQANHAPAAEVLRASGDPPDLSDLRVLIVDDDQDALDVVRAILESCGATVVPAASVSEAVAAAQGTLPDVLVGDLGMPEQDGFDLIRLIRSLPEGRTTPAIALTAFSSPQHREAALRAGYDAHLSKPVEAMRLCALIAELGRGGRAGA